MEAITNRLHNGLPSVKLAKLVMSSVACSLILAGAVTDLSSAPAWAQSGGEAASVSEIAGDWLLEDQYVLSISGDTAVLKSLLDERFPKKLLGKTFYSDIAPAGNNTWRANRWQWKFIDDPENGRWVNEGSVNLQLNANGGVLVQGSRTFRRIGATLMSQSDPKAQQSQGATVVLHGVEIRYTSVVTRQGSKMVFVRIENKNPSLAARVSFVYPGGKLDSDFLSPGERFQGPINSADFDLEMSFRQQLPSSAGADPVQVLRDIVREHVSIGPDGVKRISRPVGGVRG